MSYIKCRHKIVFTLFIKDIIWEIRMQESKIREKYQREDENDLRGTNVEAMNQFIEMLKLHEKSEDPRIRNIAENFMCIDKVAPNFTIFQGKKCYFMHNFKAYQISKDTNMLVATHEFGHAMLSIMNDTVVPENYGELVERAKQHALSPENKENFKEYIQYISGKTDKKEKRTDAEKGPVSDIISSIFQLQGLRIGTYDNVCYFPSSHSREYYYDEEQNKPNIKNIFDEDFANYYSLQVNRCTQEIEIIRNLFGDELIQAMDKELDKIFEKLLQIKETDKVEVKEDSMERIKNAIIFTKQSEIDQIDLIDQKENLKEQEGKGERNE